MRMYVRIYHITSHHITCTDTYHHHIYVKTSTSCSPIQFSQTRSGWNSSLMANLFFRNWIKGPFSHSNDRWKCWDNNSTNRVLRFFKILCRVEKKLCRRRRHRYRCHRCYWAEIRLKDLTFSGIYKYMGGPPAKGKSLANETSRSKETLNLHLNIFHVAYKREYQRWKRHFASMTAFGSGGKCQRCIRHIMV